VFWSKKVLNVDFDSNFILLVIIYYIDSIMLYGKQCEVLSPFPNVWRGWLFFKKIITHFIKNLFKYVKVQIILNKTDDQSCGKKSTVSYHTIVIGRSTNRLMLWCNFWTIKLHIVWLIVSQITKFGTWNQNIPYILKWR